MKRRKGKRPVALWGSGVLLLLFFFTVPSLLHIQESFYVYKTAKQIQEDAYLEREYVKKQLEDLKTRRMRKKI